MTVVDLSNPEARAQAIADGSVWSGPTGAQEAACEDIAAKRVPMPGYLPQEARIRVMQLMGVDSLPGSPAASDGAGPA